MATKFITPEVTNTIHVATGVEHYTSVYNLVDMKEHGGTQLMVQVNQTLAYKLLNYVEMFNISVEPNKNLTTDCIRGSTTFSGRFIDRMIQHVITETNELNQQEAMEVEAPTNVELGNTLVANNDA